MVQRREGDGGHPDFSANSDQHAIAATSTTIFAAPEFRRIAGTRAAPG
jgi:hypothetical protein